MSRLYPDTWTDPTAALDARDFDELEIQVVTNPGVAYTPQRSLDGTNYVACNVYDKDGVAVASITAAGIYSMDAGAYCKLAGGSGSTVTYRAA